MEPLRSLPWTAQRVARTSGFATRLSVLSVVSPVSLPSLSSLSSSSITLPLAKRKSENLGFRTEDLHRRSWAWYRWVGRPQHTGGVVPSPAVKAASLQSYRTKQIFGPSKNPVEQQQQAAASSSTLTQAKSANLRVRSDDHRRRSWEWYRCVRRPQHTGGHCHPQRSRRPPCRATEQNRFSDPPKTPLSSSSKQQAAAAAAAAP